MRRFCAMTLLMLAGCGGPADTGPVSTKPGTLAAVRYDQHLTAGDLGPAAEDLVNPFAGDPAAIQQGKALFATMNCDGCHGEGALGFAAPSLADKRWRYGGDDGALFHSVFFGRPKGMPAYGGLLPEETIWQLVSYVQAQPVPAVVPTLTWP